MTKPHFGSIDFYESVILIGLGLVDFDETYPHVTKQIKEWEETWKASETVQYAKVEYATFAIQIGEIKRRVYFAIHRPDLLPAVALLINLKTPQSIDAVEEILLNLFQSTEFKITQ